MKVAVRADASGRIGTGHVVRCLNLAQALKARGAVVRFVCREHTGHLIGLARAQGFEVAALPAPARPPDPTSENYAEWLGVGIEQDAQDTTEALAGETIDWLVMDHYGLDAQWQRRLRPHAGRILAIDDLPGRVHDCDLLLDQNLAGPDAQDGSTRAPGAGLLIGPRYALLRDEYAQRRALMAPREPRVTRVLVFFGGTDPDNLTGLALEALSMPALAGLAVDVVAGPNYPYREQLQAQASRRGNTIIHAPQPHLADLMLGADLAVGGGGTTTWERMCLGLPAVVVSLAENQRPACLALARQDLAAYAGHFDDVRSEALAALIASVANDPRRLARLSRQGMLLVDGLGAQRVAEAMAPAPTRQLSLRRAEVADAADYFFWVNDPAVRASAFHTAPIAWDAHEAWFTARLADPASRLFVLEAAGLPVGQVRFDRREDGTYIDYTLDPLVRGRGWAPWLVQEGMDSLRAEGPVAVHAEVKPGNEASLAVLRKLGFGEGPAAPGRRVFVHGGAQ